MTPSGTRVRELRGQLAVLALALWTVAAVNACTPDRYLRSGQLKGTDFVQFYTLASLAARGEIRDFDDFGRLHRLQRELVPESGDLVYPPVNGPQLALVLKPLARFSYGGALVVWLAATSVIFIGAAVLVAFRLPMLRPYVGTVALGAMAFPPFWQLIQHGQLTAIAVTSVMGAWLAMRRGRTFLAGLCLGLLAYKPPLIAPVLLVLALAGAWRTMVGAILVGASQVLVAGVWIGVGGLIDYAQLLLSLPASASLLAVKPAEMHSLRTFWELLIPWTAPALVAYAVTAAAAVGVAASVWRRTDDASTRSAALVLATVLAAPHLYVYDLSIVGPAWLWLLDRSLSDGRDRRTRQLLVVGYLAPLAAPLVAVIPLQISTICFAALLASLRWPTSARSPLSGRTAPTL